MPVLQMVKLDVLRQDIKQQQVALLWVTAGTLNQCFSEKDLGLYSLLLIHMNRCKLHVGGRAASGPTVNDNDGIEHL